MNWFLFVIVSWVLLGLEIGLKDAFELGSTDVAPSLTLPLAMFVAMHASARTTTWACIFIGILFDMSSPVPTEAGGAIWIAGPYALGYCMAGQVALGLRGMMFRRNPLSMVFLCVLGSLVCHATVVVILTVRSLYGDPIVWDAPSQMLSRLGISAYTGVSALIEAFILFPMMGLFHFHAVQQYAFNRRDR